MLLKIPDTLTLETEEDVRALRDLLDCYLSLHAHRTPAETPQATEPPETALLPNAPRTPAQKPSHSPIGKKTVEHFYHAALQALGGRGTSEEVYQKFLELGFPINSKEPFNAVSTYLRQKGKFVRLPPNERGVTRWGLKEEA